MRFFPKLPKGVSWKDIEIIMSDQVEEEKGMEQEPIFKNRKTGEIYR